MSNLVKHAEMEFKAANWLNEDGTFKDEMQEAICNHVLDLLKVFSDEGHSGSSAPYAVDMFKKLAMFEPLVPLTGEDWEWSDVGHLSEKPYWQNKRCSHVFKDGDGKPYDIHGKVFYEWCIDKETGEKYKSSYTSRESHVYITFPYTPTTEYVEKTLEK